MSVSERPVKVVPRVLGSCCCLYSPSCREEEFSATGEAAFSGYSCCGYSFSSVCLPWLWIHDFGISKPFGSLVASSPVACSSCSCVRPLTSWRSAPRRSAPWRKVDLTRFGGHPKVWRQSLRKGSPYAEPQSTLPRGV